jgi:hypothetical protein
MQQTVRPKLFAVRAQKPWPRGNYVCTFAFRVLDMAAGQEQC